MSNESRITDYGSPITHNRSRITNYPRVSIIILNWNGWKDTVECLESLYQITYPNYDVILIDNGSKDESIQKIKEYCAGKIKVESKFFEYNPDNKPIKIIEYTREEAEAGGGKEKEIAHFPSNRRMIIIKNEKNYGFAEGNNIGIRYALKALNPDYVLLLNNDTVVDKSFLGELVKVGEGDEKIGVVGPKIYYYDEPEEIWFVGGKISFLKGSCKILRAKTEANLDYIAGTALMIKTKVIEQIGLLDKEYFAYWEETDWCVRAKKESFKLSLVAKSKIWHKISVSTKKVAGLSEYYLQRNRFLFMSKNACLSNKILFIFWSISFDFFLRSFALIYNQNFTAYKNYLKGTKDGLLYLTKHVLIENKLGIKMYKILVQKLHYMNFIKAMEAKIISEFLDVKRGEKICDIACGSGQQSIKLAKRGCKVYGIDLNSKAIKTAKLIAKGYDCDFQVGNANRLPYNSNYFDKVVSVCALEHFENDEKALEEMYRVLKSNGVLVLTVDSFTYKGIKDRLKEVHRRDHHVVNYYSYYEISKKLEKCRFKIEGYKYFVNSPISSFFFNLGIRLKYGYLFKVIFPIAYSMSIASDWLMGKKEEGYILAIKAIKQEERRYNTQKYKVMK